MKADRTLKDKLLADKPAIFNWRLEGYNRLRQTSAFTVTDDSEDLKQSFREVINPFRSLFPKSRMLSILMMKTPTISATQSCINSIAYGVKKQDITPKHFRHSAENSNDLPKIS